MNASKLSGLVTKYSSFQSVVGSKRRGGLMREIEYLLYRGTFRFKSQLRRTLLFAQNTNLRHFYCLKVAQSDSWKFNKSNPYIYSLRLSPHSP